jgi:hypothetical protein
MKAQKIVLIVACAIVFTLLTVSIGSSECGWFAVGYNKSHFDQGEWCPRGWIITQLDFDGGGYGNNNMGNFPIVARVKCCRLTGGSIGSLPSQEKADCAQALDAGDNVKVDSFLAGDIVFQKNDQKLWRLFEDEEGLYLQNLQTGKVYRFVLEEVESE